jgi:hypothetical protein
MINTKLLEPDQIIFYNYEKVTFIKEFKKGLLVIDENDIPIAILKNEYKYTSIHEKIIPCEN